MAKGALENLKVVELGSRVSAPYTAKLFADFGADVIKVEPPAGDPARRWGPFAGGAPHSEKSGPFFFLNTNKRGVTLDVESASGKKAFLSLIRDADVLIENQRPVDMRAWGLTYDSLAAVNPNLVMISITPFGQTGPYAHWNAYDLNAFHLTGAGSRYCGLPGQAPLEQGTFAADYYGAISAASWGLAAVYGRARAGGGQHVDVSCAEAIAATFVGSQNIGAYAQDGVFEKRTGVGMPLGAPATILPCKDGHVWMLALQPAQWNGLVKALGTPEWAQLEMFQDMFMRAQNSDIIYPLIEEWTMERGKMEIMDVCQAEGVPVTAVFSVAEAVEHPHIAARDYLVELDHAEMGRVQTFGAPFKLPACPGGATSPAPLLGEHNNTIAVEGSAFSAPSTNVLTNDGAPKDGKRPLEGIRVANFGWVWAGPVTGQTLGFLGAEVYKIESETRIDLTRTLPPFAEGEAGPSRSLSNHAAWAGNGSVTLNLKEEQGLELAKRIIAESDVVVENFGPGVMEQLGLGYEELKKIKSDIVLFSMPAAGLYGPLRDVRTYGMSLTSTTGLDSLTGYNEGPPLPMENAFSDPYNGIFGAFAVITALNHRDLTGEGQHIDYSQQEAIMQMIGPAFMDYKLTGKVAGPMGNRHPLGAAAPHGVFPCAGEDRWISIAVENDEEWSGLSKAMGGPEWATAFDSAAARLNGLDDLHEKLGAWTAGFDDRELAEALQRHGVAAAPVLNVADLLSDPHYQQRQTFIEVTHPLGFKETIYGAYVKMSASEPKIEPGPQIGRDNDHVFKNLLKLDDDEYSRLVDAKVIY
jgi:benzylsuccinate CoA-transferase BbsF subunit